ncbi:MAG: 30S ribosomal protein S15 [Myxococcota bacterium]
MALHPELKTEIVAQHRTHETDTGSPEVQIALMTARISRITSHLGEKHQKDTASRRGLLKLVSRRRRLLRYLRGQSPERYRSLINKLGIRK